MNLYTKFEVSILNGYGDIYEEKSGEKEKGKIQGRTNRRMPICNPTIQLVANLYTKFENSILNGCGDIFDEKSGETEKRTTKSLILDPTRQQPIVHVYTKFQHSSLKNF